MTRDELVDKMIAFAKTIWSQFWQALPDEQRLRLGGMEEEIRAVWSLSAENAVVQKV